jgi:hypothetical protein
LAGARPDGEKGARFGASSFRIVTLAPGPASVAFVGLPSSTRKPSSGSATPSATIGTSIIRVVSPGAKVKVPKRDR